MLYYSKWAGYTAPAWATWKVLVQATYDDHECHSGPFHCLNDTSLSSPAHEAHLKVGMADMLHLQSCSRNRSTEWLQPTPRWKRTPSTRTVQPGGACLAIRWLSPISMSVFSKFSHCSCGKTSTSTFIVCTVTLVLNRQSSCNEKHFPLERCKTPMSVTAVLPTYNLSSANAFSAIVRMASSVILVPSRAKVFKLWPRLTTNATPVSRMSSQYSR